MINKTPAPIAKIPPSPLRRQVDEHKARQARATRATPEPPPGRNLAPPLPTNQLHQLRRVIPLKKAR